MGDTELKCAYVSKQTDRQKGMNDSFSVCHWPMTVWEFIPNWGIVNTPPLNIHRLHLSDTLQNSPLEFGSHTLVLFYVWTILEKTPEKCQAKSRFIKKKT